MKLNVKQIQIFILMLLCVYNANAVGLSIDLEEDSIQLTNSELYERESIKEAKAGNDTAAVYHLQQYIKETGDFNILENSNYEDIRNAAGFIALKEKYLPKFSISTFFYLYVGLIGFFIAFILNLRKKTDHSANALIGIFVFIHSFFLIHVSLYLTNYTYLAPHTLSMSTVFSFLYGPVLYFYFKRVSENYSFKKMDLLHLLPTLAILIFFLPIYALSAEEKLQIMLGAAEYGEHPYLRPVTIIKLTSLIVYGYLTFKVYQKNTRKKGAKQSKKIKLQKTIMIIHAVYALSYALYAFVIIQNVFSGMMFNLQLFAMTALVLYIGYIAYANPQILAGFTPAIQKTSAKYKNSGLTPSFSLELKEQLVALLEEDKVYRKNSIKLEAIAQRLNTTRHNASQIINEHFGMNFFELINKYRVEEAMELLKTNNGDLNIIDIAYEVGYNNKVTFNKSFKRFSNLTPSQFAKLSQAS